MSVIMLPTWGIEGIVFNSIDADGVEWIVQDDEGWDAAPGPRLSMTDKTVGDGAYDGRSWLEPRTVVLDVRIIAPNRTLLDAAVRRVAAIGVGGGRSVLTVTEPDRALSSEVRLAVRTEVKRVSTTSAVFQLSLIAPDPRKFSTTPRSVTAGLASGALDGTEWNGPAGATGTQWNGPAGSTGVQWGASGTSNIATLDNSRSTATADILFTITGPVTNPSVQNMETNQVFTYGGSLLTGETLTVNTGSGAVLFQGVNRGPLMNPAQFFSLPPGSITRIAFTAAGGSGQLTASWSDSYL